jgi:SAM-dependent methyltransferase
MLVNNNKANFDGLYTDAVRYDLQNEYYKEDIDFYLSYLKDFDSNYSILELAVGTGRVGLALRTAGFSVFGIDTSEIMLDRAKLKASAINTYMDLANADITDFNFNRNFDLIILPLNTLTHLEDYKSQRKSLHCIKKHLLPSGQFILDVFNPNLEMLLRRSTHSYPLMTYYDSRLKSEVKVFESSFYESKTQINRIKYTYEIDGFSAAHSFEFGMRIFFPAELDNLLIFNGFNVKMKYGDYNLSPFSSDSPRQIVICSKSGE